MNILGIDPGPKQSGWVLWDTIYHRVEGYGHQDNEDVKQIIYIPDRIIDTVAIEMITGYGVVSGDDTFNTCRWVGIFEEAARVSRQIISRIYLVPRKEVKRVLCGNTTTNDKYVRQALIDRYGDQGTKKNPGPLYGIAGHTWAALAVAVVAGEKE